MGKLRLTQDQRRIIFDGGAPKISGEGKPPVEPGHVYKLSPRLKLEVEGYRTPKRGGWSMIYTVYDRRDPVRLLKRTPSVHYQDWAEVGKREAPLTREQQEVWEREAAEESAYTSSLTPLGSAGEAVSQSAQERFSRRARDNRDQRTNLARIHRERYEMEQRLLRARQDALDRGVDISSPLRVIERQLQKIEGRLYEGKAA